MNEGIEEELKFWDNWFLEKGGIYSHEYQRRLNPNLEFEKYLSPYLSGLNLTTAKILDAGAGPVSCLGKIHHNIRLNITAADALASHYNELYKKHKYNPVLPTVFGDFLNLSKSFGENVFDFVYSRNSLDHCANPINGIFQLIQVCKPGKYIFFENAEAEATREKGTGLHQWDFLAEDNDLIIQNYLDKKKISLKETCKELTDSISVGIAESWIKVEIKKRS